VKDATTEALDRGVAYLSSIYHPEWIYDEDYAYNPVKRDEPWPMGITFRTWDMALMTRYLIPPSIRERLSPELQAHVERVIEGYREHLRGKTLTWEHRVDRIPIDNYAMYPLWHDEPAFVEEMLRTFDHERGGWPLISEDPTYPAHRRTGDEIYPIVVLLREGHLEQADRALEIKLEVMKMFVEAFDQPANRTSAFQGVLQIFQALAAAERYGCGTEPAQVTAWVDEAEAFLLKALRETALMVINHLHSLFLLQYTGRKAPDPEVVTELSERVLAGQEQDTGAWTWLNPNDPRVKKPASWRSNGTLWALGALSAGASVLAGEDVHWLHPAPRPAAP
jgi:hypothetical protein